jgi:hypothetical protein
MKQESQASPKLLLSWLALGKRGDKVALNMLVTVSPEDIMHPLRALREQGPNTPEKVAELLAEDVVFHSPIFVKGVEGRDAVARVFAASSSVRSGSYVREDRLDDRTTFIHWAGEIAGHTVESLEVIVDDENGLVKDRTVAFRPFPAVALFRTAVYPALRDLLGPEYWSYDDSGVDTHLPD